MLPDWLQLDPATMGWVFALSVAVAVGTFIAIPIIIVRLPADYFTRPRRKLMDRLRKHPMGFGALLVGKNLLGIVLLLAGIAMLVLPGQGLLTILISVLLLDFPRKYRVERWLVSRKHVQRSLNWMREKAGKNPLELPSTSGDEVEER